MIDALCEGSDEFWHLENGQRVVNIYALTQSIEKWARAAKGRSPIAQSTLARSYAGQTENFSPRTAHTLSEFFRVPRTVVTGDLRVTNEDWGMDITIAEIRWIMLMRELTPDQRTAIYANIRAMLPADIAVPPIPPGLAPILKLGKH